MTKNNQALKMPDKDRLEVETALWEQTIATRTYAGIINKVMGLLTDEQLFTLYEHALFDLNMNLHADAMFPEALFVKHRRKHDAGFS